MSETIATRTVTVSLVSRRSGAGTLGPILLAVASAELGVRLLRPRQEPLSPARIDLHRYFSAEEIERGKRFARPQMAIGLANSVIRLAALVTVARRPPRLGRLDPIAGGAVSAAGLAAGLALPALPLAALSRRRAIEVGLITQSWRGWAADLIKSNLIESTMAAADGAVVEAATRRYTRAWWLVGAGGTVAAGALLVAISPVLLDPVFNTFTPLPEGETRSDVLELARAAGIKVGEVYSVDASRRTTAANAYVTGLGPTKRVVLFDTLLDRYGPTIKNLVHVRQNQLVKTSISYVFAIHAHHQPS
jgi:STE24 endopeptidase